MSNNSAWRAVNNAARAEDLAWMARWGESCEGAASRLGLSLEALTLWCRRHGCTDLLERLRQNGREAA